MENVCQNFVVILVILFMCFWLLAPKDFFDYLVFKYLVLIVPDECYSRKTSWALNQISTFLLLQSLPFLIHDLSSGFNKSNTTGSTSGAGTVYPSDSEAHEFIPCFQWGQCCSICSFCVVSCRPQLVFVLFLSVMVLSVLLLVTAVDYLFGIFKLIFDSCRTAIFFL